MGFVKSNLLMYVLGFVNSYLLIYVLYHIVQPNF